MFAISQEEGFAGVALMMLLFPFFFLVGLVTMLIGVFKKESTNKNLFKKERTIKSTAHSNMN
ncbi:hypothetical protein ABEY44_02635 [Priestia megaterium]